jgi:hypothetical protein
MKNKTNGDISPKKTFSHDQLWAALRDVEDLMERCAAPMFLLADTAKQVLEDKPLTVDRIEVGLRRAELMDSRISTMKMLRPGIVINESECLYDTNGVPVFIQIFEKEHEFFKNLDTCMYLVGNYKIPNPFDKYYQARFILK